MRNTYIVTNEHITAHIEKTKADVRAITLDYTKFLSRLGGITISTSTWAEDDGGITIDSESETTTSTTATISSGNNNDTYLLENTITTNDNQTFKKGLKVRVKELSTDLTMDYQ